MPHKQKFFYILIHLMGKEPGEIDVFAYTEDAYDPREKTSLNEDLLIPLNYSMTREDFMGIPKFTEIKTHEIMKKLEGVWMRRVSEEEFGWLFKIEEDKNISQKEEKDGADNTP